MARRRRKASTKKNSRPSGGRIVLIGAAVLLVLGVAVIFAGYAGIRRYLHSDAFRAMVSDRTSDFLRADAHFEPFHWKDTSAYSDGLRAEGRPGAVFSKLRADSLQADIDLDAVRDGVWKITSLQVSQLNLLIEGGEDEQSASSAGGGNDRPPSDSEPAPSDSGEGGGLLAGILPNRLEVEEIRVMETNVNIERPAQPKTLIRRARIVARPRPGGIVDLVASGGTVRMGEFPEMKIEEIETRVTPDKIFLTRASGEALGGARISAAGEILKTSPSRVDLDVTFSNLEADRVVSEDWAKRASGTLSGEVNVSGSTGALREEGTVALENGVIEALPVLDRIATYTRTDNFRRLVLHRAEADFTREGGATRISRLVLESSGLLMVDGALDIRDGEVDGTFEVGVTPGALRWIPGAEQKVFTRSQDGFVWTSMRVTGPLGSLREDLSSRLVSGAIAHTMEMIPETALDAVESGGKAVKSGAESLRDGAGSLLDQGAGLLRGILGQ